LSKAGYTGLAGLPRPRWRFRSSEWHLVWQLPETIYGVPKIATLTVASISRASSRRILREIDGGCNRQTRRSTRATAPTFPGEITLEAPQAMSTRAGGTLQWLRPLAVANPATKSTRKRLMHRNVIRAKRERPPCRRPLRESIESLVQAAVRLAFSTERVTQDD
jgi:hypothetical protein